MAQVERDSRRATVKNALPSHVRLLDLIDFGAYGTPGKHPGVAWDVAARWIFDYARVIGGRALAGPDHVLAVGRVGPMLVVDALRGGVGVMTISRTVHDNRMKGEGRVGRGGPIVREIEKKRDGAKWSHNHGSLLYFRSAIPRIRFRRLISSVHIYKRWIDCHVVNAPTRERRPLAFSC